MTYFEGLLLIDEGKRLLQAGHISDAEAIFRQALKSSGENNDVELEMRARLLLAACLGAASRYSEALATCNRVILWTRNQDGGALLVDSGKAASLGCAAMIEACVFGYALAKTDTEFQAVLDACSETERFILEYNMNRFRPDLLVIRSQALQSLGRQDEAKLLAEEAAFGVDSDISSVIGAGMIFTSMSESELALTALEQYGTSDDNDLFLRVSYHLSLAVELSEADPPKLSEALYHVRNAVALAETSEVTRLLCGALVLHADIAGELEHWQEVNGALQRLYNILPDVLDTQKSQFVETLKTGDLGSLIASRLPLERAVRSANKSPDALKTTEEIVRCLKLVEPNSSGLYNSLANAYEASELHEKAIEAYQKAIEFRPEAVLLQQPGTGLYAPRTTDQG